MSRYCPECGLVYDDDANFCAECSVRLVDRLPEEEPSADVYRTGTFEEGEPEMPQTPPPPGMPEGINHYEGQFFWEGSCPVSEYPVIFRLPMVCIAIVGGLIALIIALVGSVPGTLACIGVTAALMFVVYLAMMLRRGGRFHAHFAAEAERVTISEDAEPPKNVFLLILYCVLSVILFILQLAWILIGQGVFADLTSSRNYHKEIPYKKIRSVSISPDGSKIILQKNSGRATLLATPETGPFLADQISRKVAQAQQGK